MSGSRVEAWVTTHLLTALRMRTSPRRLINARAGHTRHFLLDCPILGRWQLPTGGLHRSTQVMSWPRTGGQVGAVSFPLVGRRVIILQM